MFRALVAVANKLIAQGEKVVIACNDPIDLPVARELYGSSASDLVTCPKTVDEYFELLSMSRAVISGRLHTAVVAFSLAIPFQLIDVDQRTNGFVKTYQLEDWAIDAVPGFEAQLLAGPTIIERGTFESGPVCAEERSHVRPILWIS